MGPGQDGEAVKIAVYLNSHCHLTQNDTQKPQLNDHKCSTHNHELRINTASILGDR